MGNTNMPFNCDDLPVAKLNGRFNRLDQDECDDVTNMNLQWNEIVIVMNYFSFCAIYAKTEAGLQYIRPCAAHRRCNDKDCDTTFGYHSNEYEVLFDLKCHCKNITSDNTIDVTESLKIVEES